MKHGLIKGIFLFLSQFALAEEVEEPITPSQVAIIPYGRMAGHLIGAGVTFQAQRGYLGLEFDANTSFLEWNQLTVAVVAFPTAYEKEAWRQGGWNFGFGGGLVWPKLFTDPHLCVPIFFGYQDKKFLRIEIDCIFSNNSTAVYSIPLIKFGTCF